MNSDQIDVLLICALKDEYDQVLNVTNGLIDNCKWHEHTGPHNWLVSDATFSTSYGKQLTFRTTWLEHMGREQAQAVASMLIQAHPVRCIAMSGICGGRRGKVSLGDVIFADRLWSYDAGKTVVEDGKSVFQGDMMQYRPSFGWPQRMQAFNSGDPSWLEERPALPLENQEDWVLLQLHKNQDPRKILDFQSKCPDWTEALKRLWKRGWVEKPLTLTISGHDRASELDLLYPSGLPLPEAFKIIPAPIGTGAAVMEDSGIFPRLSGSMRKVLGIDMEASALGILGEIHNIPVLIAKGVSDYGDPFKDDRYRHFAARASAECLIALIRQSADLLPDHVATKSTAAPILTDNSLPTDLIAILSDVYPDVQEARALWTRAGGKNSDVENITRPRDLWQKLWLRCTQGAIVRPIDLLNVALQDLPSNAVLHRYISIFSNP